MKRMLVVIGLLALPPAAMAQTSPPTAPPTLEKRAPQPAAENGRFSMMPSGDGFLRLDTRTGVVSFCTVREGAAQCRSSADERGALEAEIDRLAGENAILRRGSDAQGAASPRAEGPGLPTDAEVDRAIGLIEKIVRGTVRIMKEVDSATQK